MQHVKWMKKGTYYLEWENKTWEMNNTYVIHGDNFGGVSLLTCLSYIHVYKSPYFGGSGFKSMPKDRQTHNCLIDFFDSFQKCTPN
jgi:hypothetical protein